MRGNQKRVMIAACFLAALASAQTSTRTGTQPLAPSLAALPPTQAVTLDQVLALAAADEPGFAAARAEQRVTALQRKDARAALLPSAIAHNQFLFTESNHTHTALGTPFSPDVTQAGVEQSLPVFIANNAVHEYYNQAVVNETLGLAQFAGVRLADANAALAAAQLEVARRGLVATVVSLFYGVTVSEQKTVIAERARREADHFVDITQKREIAREAAHADVLKAQIQQQQRERELEEAKLTAARSHLELGVLLYPDPATAFTLAMEAPAPLPDRTGIEAAARSNNPELRSAFANLAVNLSAVTTAQAALLPDLALNFTYGIDAPQFSNVGPSGARNLGYSAGVTVDLPLWDWLSTERKVKEARIRTDVARVALTATQRRLLADLSEFWAEAETAQRQLASLDTTVVAARESLRLTNLRYVDGESTALEVVDAQSTLISAEDAQVDGAVRYQLARAQLQTLTGKL